MSSNQLTSSTLTYTQPIHVLFGCQLNNAELAREALMLPGAVGARPEGNRRLAMLGDAIIKVVMHEHWYMSGAPCSHGNNLSSTILSNDNLNRVGLHLGLEHYIRKHPSQITGISQKAMATTVEAIFGAIWLELGLNAVRHGMTYVGLIVPLA